jgi:CDP-glycerol glycerophosphotransferase (TagB/SpsB family)
MAAQRAADVLVSDTSSIVSEFVVQYKPVVTFRNRVPQPHMIDFDDATRLPAMLDRALSPEPALVAQIQQYADSIHPYRDGYSSERVIAATEDFLAGELGTLKRKPFGAWTRGLQIRRDLGYWGPSKR